MAKQLKPDELSKIPVDGVDYKDFILQVASNNNWVFNLTDYSTAIVNAKKGALTRVSVCLQEMESEGVVIKTPHRKVYTVTTLGIKVHEKGGFKEIEEDTIPISYSLDAETGHFKSSGADLRFELDRNKTESKLLSRIFAADKVAAISAFITAVAVSFQVYYVKIQVSLQEEELTSKEAIETLQETINGKDEVINSLHLTIDSLLIENSSK